MIQKTNIDALHKEGKSQRVITERCGCLQSAVSQHIKCKVDWKEEKGAQATGMTASLRIQSSKANSNTWESFTRSGLKLESVNQESPRSDVFRKRATKPLLNQKQHQKHLTWAVEKKNWTVAQWSKVLFSDESKFCISLGNQGPRVWRKSGEAQNPCCLKSSVKFPQSVMIWAAMSSAGVGPLCFLKSTVNAAIYQEILEHFMLPSADKLYGDADYIFQQDLAPAHTAKGTKSWFNDHGVTVLDWPANSPDLNPIENLWGIVKRKMKDTRPNNADDLKATVKETWASIPPQQCHKLITSMPRRIEAVITAKGAPTKYWVHTGAGHIIRISSKSWFISLIPFKKWNLYNVYIHSTQTDIFQVFISFNFYDYNWQLMKTPNSVSQKIRILLKTNTKKGFLEILANWKVWACTALNT